MPAKEQIEAVKAELMKRNPGFDGKTVTHKLDKDGTVTELQFFTDTVIDLSPVRALTQLKSLYCPGIEGKERKLADLTPLAGMRLEHLDISITSVSDLSPLKDMKLKTLSLVAAPVADLTPLRGM